MMGILNGSLAGIAYGLLLGPLFFAGVRATILNGKKAGFSVVAGSFTSDCCMAVAGYLGAAAVEHWITLPAVSQVLHLSGGLILTGFGVVSMVVQPRIDLTATENERPRRHLTGFWQDALIGFSINTMNPSNWLFWAGVAAAFGRDGNGIAALSGALITVGLSDALKIMLTFKIAKRLDQKWLVFFVKIAGLIMLVLGIVVLMRLAQWI